MKVALNPAELRLIVDALDDKHQFQLQSGAGEGGVGIKRMFEKSWQIKTQRYADQGSPQLFGS